MEKDERPNLSGTALLVIDVQDSFKAGGLWERRWNLSFETKVSELLRGSRALGHDVMFFMHQGVGAAFRLNSPYYRLMDFIDRESHEPLLHKTTRNCFTSTDLHRRLVQRGVQRLIVCGIQTEQCCETTTRLAADYGYDVDFVLEATQTFPISGPDGELDGDAIAQRTAYALRDRFARVSTVEEALAR